MVPITIQGPRLRCGAVAAAAGALVLAALASASGCAIAEPVDENESAARPTSLRIDARSYRVGDVIAIEIPESCVELKPHLSLIERVRERVLVAEIFPTGFIAITESGRSVDQLAPAEAAARAGGAEVLLRALGAESTARSVAKEVMVGGVVAPMTMFGAPVVLFASLYEATRIAIDPQKHLEAVAQGGAAPWTIDFLPGRRFVFFPAEEYRELVFRAKMSKNCGSPPRAFVTVGLDFPRGSTPTTAGSPPRVVPLDPIEEAARQ